MQQNVHTFNCIIIVLRWKRQVLLSSMFCPCYICESFLANLCEDILYAFTILGEILKSIVNVIISDKTKICLYVLIIEMLFLIKKIFLYRYYCELK